MQLVHACELAMWDWSWLKLPNVVLCSAVMLVGCVLQLYTGVSLCLECGRDAQGVAMNMAACTWLLVKQAGDRTC